MKRGLTLLEVLVAAVLLAVGLLGAMEVIGRTAAGTRAVEDRARGLMLARSKMEEILKQPTLQVGTDRGEGEGGAADYEWEVSIEQSASEGLMLVTVLVRNRVTGVELTPLSCLRRPDLNPLADGTAGTTPTTPAPGTGTAGGLL